MRSSKLEINKNLEKEIFNILYELISDIDDPEEAKILLDDLLGKSETFALAKRIAIADYLNHGRSYENIKENLKVSSATIATIDKLSENKGFQIALKKISVNKWASKWSEKIDNIFK